MKTTESRVTDLDGATFEAATAAGTGVVAVEFGAEWCGPCHMLAPVLEAAARELEGRVRFHAVDADTNPELVVRFGVRGLPTVLLFDDGEVVDRIVGALPLAPLMARIDAVLG